MFNVCIIIYGIDRYNFYILFFIAYWTFSLNMFLLYCRCVIASFLLLATVTADGHQKRASSEFPSSNQTGQKLSVWGQDGRILTNFINVQNNEKE